MNKQANLVLISKKLPISKSNPSWKQVDRIAQIEICDSKTKLEKSPHLENATAIISMLSDKIDARFLDKAPNLKVLCNYAVGFNNIDLDEARRRKIVVCNTPDVLTNATAELTIGLLFAAARRFKESDALIRLGKFKGWAPELLLGRELANSTLGLIGFGRIGQEVGHKAKALGMRVQYFSRSRKSLKGFKPVTLTELLSTSDFISIHCPLIESDSSALKRTRNLLGKKEFQKIKKGAYLINTARGEIIDENFLILALRTGRLAGAALDVFCGEPKLNPRLRNIPNLYVLPHIGSATLEARCAMAQLSLHAVSEVLSGRMPKNRIN